MIKLATNNQQRLRFKRAQSTVEYAVLIVVVAAALFTIQTYTKRSVQGSIKKASDDLGNQFSPGATRSEWVVKRKSATKDTFILGETKSELVNRTVKMLEDPTDPTSGRDVLIDGDSTEMESQSIINSREDFWGIEHN